jgi:putative nucleotidyltransferase with HDIG domain
MNKFLDYLNPKFSLGERLISVLDETYVPEDRREKIIIFLAPLKMKDLMTYEHSIRVGLLAVATARVMHLEDKALLYPGLLHDTGKTQTNSITLKKTEGWTDADTAEIKRHVMDGYRMIRGQFDFSAEVILWHHRFQSKGYPQRLPNPLHSYGRGTKMLIAMYGRILALVDCFDALHRVNDKHKGSPMTGKEIKDKMLELNPDQRFLINELYDAGVFTTHLVP